MRFFYNTGSALSGYDQYGHYQRTNVIITGCTEYKLARFSNCPTQWDFTRTSLSETAREVLPELESGGIGTDETLTPEVPEDPDGEVVPIPDPESDPDLLPEQEGATGPEASTAPDGGSAPAQRRSDGRMKGDPRQATQMAILEYLLGR